MKTNVKMLKMVSEAGSMMIEALAMLTLISLVTPTLYKKSAERTNELQDINTANHVRTVMKAADSFASVNYKQILEDMQDKQVIKVNTDPESGSFADFLPYGYSFDQIKNFDKPEVYIAKQGDSANTALTAFVVFPAKGEMPSIRASRIASMVGSNGGYFDSDGSAKGVGGIWELTQDDLEKFEGVNAPSGSIISASTEAINEATRTSQENTKYLQRTDAGASKWKNTMVTDLYMGGTKDLAGNDLELRRIAGVRQLIIGDISANNNYGLYLGKNTGIDGAGEPNAFIEGTLDAINGKFKVSSRKFNEDPDKFEYGLNFADVLNVTSENTGDTLSFSNDAFQVTNPTGDDGSAEFNVATTVSNTFTTTGDTKLATQEGGLEVGDSGKIMTADATNVKMLTPADGDAKFVLSSTAEPSETSDLTVNTDTVQLKGKLTVGQEADDRFEDMDGNHKVYGDTMFNDTVYANELKTHAFDSETLHAGGTAGDNSRWLHADATGVYINNVEPEGADWKDAPLMAADNNGVEIGLGDTQAFSVNQSGTERVVVDIDKTGVYAPTGRDDGALEFGSTNASLYAQEQVDIYTSSQKEQVNIQEGALKINGHGNTVNDGVGNDITANASRFTVQTDADGGRLLNVVSGTDGQELEGDSTVEIDPTTLKVWAGGGDRNILEVNAADVDAKARGSEETSEASVYIRRGAIEVEGSSAVENLNNRYGADEGLGYIEASRFVANNKTSNGDVVEPIYSGSFNNDQIDRYMVNPAYTSVMHDIKLTTRGGARLSDILPDFINKGIYIVNNNFKETTNFNNLHTDVSGGKLVTEAQEIENYASHNQHTNPDWASPYMGMVPTPICPPGHARVITLTPASFEMAQAGEMALKNGRPYIQENYQVNNWESYSQADGMVTTPRMYNYRATPESQQIYYLGMGPDNATEANPTYSHENTPKPLYFQQSTWLKSKVIPYGENKCDGNITGHGCPNFRGWAAIMGFIYPSDLYSGLIESLTGLSEDELSGKEVYWNVFPVRANSLEAYATVYCYFDRSNIFGSGHSGTYVDQYDQIQNFRDVSDDKTKRYNYSTEGSSEEAVDESYQNRLNDPHLKYKSPW